MNVKGKRRKKYRRHKRVRGKISGTAKRPRLCVFRSNKHIYAQLIDDERNRIIASASDLELNVVKKSKKSIKKATAGKEEFSGKLAPAFEVGKLIAQKAKELKIKEIVFDRGGYKYHGRVKSLAEGARAGELKF
ncbi:MAG: 50S ribosomal protein L18 [Candidatus Nealsonbacteria bacterium]